MKQQIIKSKHHPIVENLFLLRTDRRYRQEKQQVLLSGKKMVAEYDKNDVCVRAICSTIAANKSDYIFSNEVMRHITGEKNPEGVVAVVPMPAMVQEKWKRTRVSRLLVLDSVRNPGNLGTLVRSSLAFGFDGIYCLPTCVDYFNAEALRAGKGATLKMALGAGNLELLREIVIKQKMKCIAAVPSGHPATDRSGRAYAIDEMAKSPLCLILGSESHGISRECVSVLKPEGVTIPTSAAVESLNVAVAGSILMHELRKRTE